ncbi:tRNA lysidine(34) synthetase TilS [Marivita sp. S2033]|uniref:tRNA lysidine(34) synthetase TilS n=1 Tax=Marivita sp. S2033 TaxID=3373187 RepID=UPI003981D376
MNEPPLQQRFADQMGQLLGPDFPPDIGLAVSGGGDSMAMLYLAHNWTHIYGVRLWVITIDHGLRAESAAEAEMVARECATLGWPHTRVLWSWDGRGNVQAAARQARLELIDRWRGSVKHVLFAHTEDDQAETVLMRLARGSGVDGLAGMQAIRLVAPHALGAPELEPGTYAGQTPPQAGGTPGFDVVRPCLGMSRAELRHYARVLQAPWIEDPSNEDRSYDRVRIRQLLTLLRHEGITASVLAKTATRLSRARAGLTARLSDAVDRICMNAPLGQVLIERDGLAALDGETQLRMLTASLRYVASSPYRPREAASEDLLERALSGRGGTLHGAEVVVSKSEIRVFREAACVRDEVSDLEALWDGQWVLKGDDSLDTRGATVRALGDKGWRQIEARENLPLTMRASLGLPSVWREDVMLACPALGIGSGITAERYVLGRRDTGFRAFCLSH